MFPSDWIKPSEGPKHCVNNPQFVLEVHSYKHHYAQQEDINMTSGQASVIGRTGNISLLRPHDSDIFLYFVMFLGVYLENKKGIFTQIRRNVFALSFIQSLAKRLHAINSLIAHHLPEFLLLSLLLSRINMRLLNAA